MSAAMAKRALIAKGSMLTQACVVTGGGGQMTLQSPATAHFATYSSTACITNPNVMRPLRCWYESEKQALPDNRKMADERHRGSATDFWLVGGGSVLRPSL